MKKYGIVNSEISTILGHMGHTDTITVADAGLPIPKDVYKIDLAFKRGEPSFLDVLVEIVKDMVIEKVYIAQEMIQENPQVYSQLKDLLKDTEFEICENHEEFKAKSNKSRAIVRTGEITPYANIILQSGVFFR